MKLIGIILAAGEASRFGRTKQLLPWGDTTLVAHACLQALACSFDEVIAVTGANHERVQAALPQDVLAVYNPDWASGMQSSLAVGLHAALNQRPTLDGALICLADQPFVNAQLLSEFIAAFTSPDAAQPQQDVIVDAVALAYPGGAGVPGLFSRKLINQLLLSSFQGGAKSLLRDPSNAVRLIDAPQARIDIDTQEDYEQALRLLENQS